MIVETKKPVPRPRPNEDYLRARQTGQTKRQELRALRALRAEGMAKLYEEGLGLSRIGQIYGLSDTCVQSHLRMFGIEMRPFHPVKLPFIEWNGSRYTWGTKSYYRRTQPPRTMLHHDVWEEAHGMPVPKGYELLHRDDNPHNNAVENLVLMSKEDLHEVTAIRTGLKKPVSEKSCVICGGPVVRHRYIGKDGKVRMEGAAAYAKRRCCSTRCLGDARKGQPVGYIPWRKP